jgi:predicted metal-dependent hydrolase
VTAALEHFTATLGELVLTSEQVRADLGHPAVADLFVWHALEETEHKAVAFDVYRAIGGGERLRVGTMRVMRAVFVVGISALVLSSLLADRDTYRPRVLWRSWQRFRRSPLVDKSVRQQLHAYDRRGFHPDDIDTSALVEEWRARLFGSEGTLRDRLSGSAPAA